MSGIPPYTFAARVDARAESSRYETGRTYVIHADGDLDDGLPRYVADTATDALRKWARDRGYEGFDFAEARQVTAPIKRTQVVLRSGRLTYTVHIIPHDELGGDSS